MKKAKIVADSSSDVLALEKVDFASAPLKIITSEKEFVDDSELDVEAMVKYLGGYSGRSTTSCPNPEDWISAFGEAEEVYCVTITSGLSGSYNSACLAKKLYEETHPERRVFVIDSLSTGPEMALIIKKLEEMIVADKSFEEISESIMNYKRKTGLLFMLESMKNLANNGRVSKLSAKFAGLLNIRVVGKASDKGELEPLDKPRGHKMTIQKITDRLCELGYKGGKLFVTHCLNLKAAEDLAESVRKLFSEAEIIIGKCRGLCSFYAESGGMLIGFEKAKGEA